MKRKKEELVIDVGSVVHVKADQEFIGEVYSIIKGRRDQFEVMLYDKRLKPIMRGDGTYRRKKFLQDDCSLLDEDFKMTTDTIELGDVICRTYTDGMAKKYGVVIGFTHPDGLMSSSYAKGYNGTDLIDCVEIEKRGLSRKRDSDGNIKRFSTFSERVSCCEVDLWNRTGPKIVPKS
jgi:hypothetical protein